MIRNFWRCYLDQRLEKLLDLLTKGLENSADYSNAMFDKLSHDYLKYLFCRAFGALSLNLVIAIACGVAIGLLLKFEKKFTEHVCDIGPILIMLFFPFLICCLLFLSYSFDVYMLVVAPNGVMINKLMGLFGK